MSRVKLINSLFIFLFILLLLSACSLPPILEIPSRVITNKKTYLLKGTTDEGAKISIIKNKRIVGKTTANDSGNFNIPISNLKEGKNRFLVKSSIEDQTTTESLNITLDTTLPPTPKFNKTAFVSSNKKQTIEGKAEKAEKVIMQVNNKPLNSVNLNKNNFKKELLLKNGINLIEAQSQDKAGNKSSKASLEIDYRPITMQTKEIPFKTITKKDPAKLITDREIIEEGEPGKIISKEQHTYRDGKIVQKKIIDAEKIKPKDEIIEVGMIDPTERSDSIDIVKEVVDPETYELAEETKVRADPKNKGYYFIMLFITEGETPIWWVNPNKNQIYYVNGSAGSASDPSVSLRPYNPEDLDVDEVFKLFGINP